MKKHRKLLTAFLAAAVITLAAASCSEPVIPQGYAMVYGVADYQGFGDLNYTDDDANALAALLEAKGWDVRLRINSEATLAQLEDDVEDIRSIVKPVDRVLFYYSGHGDHISLGGTEPAASAESREEVLLLYGSISTYIDIVYKNIYSTDIRSVTVTDDTLADLLGTIPVSTRMVIIDACRSGGFIGDGFTIDTIEPDYTKYSASSSFSPSDAVNMYIGYNPTEHDLPHSEYMVMSASGEIEDSYEENFTIQDIKHGYFTYYLLRSPEYADYNHDGYISFIEAYRYAADSIDNSRNNGGDYDSMPHVSAFPVDPVLFKAGL